MIRSAEYLPFERGFKQGLLVYWERLRIFLTVAFGAALLLGVIGSFFVPSSPKDKAGHQIQGGLALIVYEICTYSGVAVILVPLFTFLRRTRPRVFWGLEAALIGLMLVEITLGRFTWRIAFPALAGLGSLLYAPDFARILEDRVRRVQDREG